MTFDKIILAAHRGDRKKHPENTMPAFKAAIDFGVDMIAVVYEFGFADINTVGTAAV